MSVRIFALAIVVQAFCATSAIAGELLYTLESEVKLPSTDTGWDYIKMEPGSSRLFMARMKDGLTVYDVDAGRVVAHVENSVGANGPLLLPQYNRGYIAMTDGSLLVLDLKSLKPLDRKD